MLNPLWLHRIAHGLHNSHVPVVPQMMDYLIRFLFACWLPHTARIGRRAVLGYGGLGVVIHGEAQIGDDVRIDQGVTIGGNATEYGVPIVGNGVYIGAGAKILGPVIIGSNTVIGANAVVVADIPSNCLAVGVPARVIRTDIKPSAFLYHLRVKGET